MQVLKYRTDSNAEWQDILAIRGADGAPGKDGYTPVKGVDYFDGADYVLTSEDKQEIADLVLVNFVSGEEVSY